jgi:hypothetical protein
MFLLFLTAFLGSILILTELYLRIQWNIENKSKISKKAIQETRELKNIIENKFQENKEILNEIVDFLENLLTYLEDEKSERIEEITGLKDKINETSDNLRESLNNNLNEKFESTTNNLNEKFKSTTNKLSESSKFQEKLAVLTRQILEYQKDQTNFLNKELKKLKNGSKTRKK